MLGTAVRRPLPLQALAAECPSAECYELALRTLHAYAKRLLIQLNRPIRLAIRNPAGDHGSTVLRRGDPGFHSRLGRYQASHACLRGLGFGAVGGDWRYEGLAAVDVERGRQQLKAELERCQAGLLTVKGSWGSHRTPWHPVEDPLDPLQIGNVPRKRARASARPFGSTVRPTSAH